MELSDQALWERWQRGDASAFEAIVRRWEGPVGRFLVRFTGDPHRAADGLQEVFLRVYRAGPRYQPRAALSTWLFQIALNIARDLARRRRHEDRLQDWDAADDGDPEQAATANETGAAVEAALAALPETLRLVLVLHHYEGMSFDEISRVSNTPASTLKSRWAAALVRLRTLLAPFAPDFAPDYREKEP
jgi:RNA polymerase sigma-70 factor, ECF subfamily